MVIFILVSIIRVILSMALVLSKGWVKGQLKVLLRHDLRPAHSKTSLIFARASMVVKSINEHWKRLFAAVPLMVSVPMLIWAMGVR